MLPAACPVGALLAQVPSGLLLSPGDVLPGLAHTVTPLEGIPGSGVEAGGTGEAVVGLEGGGADAAGSAEGP